MSFSSKLTAAAVLSFSFLSGVEAFFRINCGVIQTGRVDPIVNPGAVAAHCHTIVGGSNVGVNSTYSTLYNSACTSCEISQDRSAYWTPNLYFEHPNGSFEEVPHSGSVVYYLGRGANVSNIIPFPEGFQMVSGNKALRAYNQSGMTWGNATYPPRPISEAISFACLGAVSEPETPGLENTTYVNSCTDGIRAQVHFQTCWNGVDLYKSDNSHVAHLSQIDNGVCPPGYPYEFSHLFLETEYAVAQLSTNTDGGRYVFSQGDATGYGFHGDFLNGWNISTLELAIAECLVDGQDDSGTVNECPILNEYASTEYTWNCPEQPAEIGEAVHGMLDKLPGCIVVTEGPEAATAADMECGAGIVQPTITKTVNSTPLPTYNPAIGASFGNSYNEYLGCGNDSYGSEFHLLNAASTTNPDMTVEYCQSYCAKRGYRYSGVEYGVQCYCDLAINPTSFFTAASNLTYGCTMLCPGNRTELCGGPFFMNVYNNTDPKFVPTTNQGDSVIQLTVPAAAYPKTYVGCASEGTSGRALNGTGIELANMTLKYCAAFCATANYAFYGLEYASQCYCGNGLASGSAYLDHYTSPTSSTCNQRCAGNFSEVCGAGGALSVYTNTKYTPVVVKSSVGRYASKGCLAEPATGTRALAGTSTASSSMTVEMCVKYCLGKQYHYAGVEYGQQCYCGNSITSGATAQTCVTSNLMVCAGNKYEYCGAGNLLNLYYSSTL